MDSREGRGEEQSLALRRLQGFTARGEKGVVRRIVKHRGQIDGVYLRMRQKDTLEVYHI